MPGVKSPWIEMGMSAHKICRPTNKRKIASERRKRRQLMMSLPSVHDLEQMRMRRQRRMNGDD